MAYRRCLLIRASLLARGSSPSFCYISHGDDRGKPEEYRPLRSAIDSYVSQRRSFRSYVKSSSWRYTGVSFGVGSGLVGGGLCKNRYSTSSTSMEKLAEEVKERMISDYPVLGEIIPSAESSLPVLAAQYLIDGAHSLTGLNWWASIALATVLIRGVTIPFLIHEAKSLKYFQCTEVLLLELGKEAYEGVHILEDMDPTSRWETLKRLKGLAYISIVTLFHGVGNLLKGMAIRGPVFVSYVLALTIMSDEVPSLKSGGVFWFTDLTTPDYTLVLPSLTILSFLASFRSFWREKLTRSNYVALHKLTILELLWKCFFGGLATCTVLLLPKSILIPKAIYFYMLTSNVFSLCVNSYLKNPNVRKALGFPELPSPIPSFYSSNIGRENWPSFYKR